MLENKKAFVASNAIALILLSGFVVTVLSLVWSKGPCCADDAYLSTIAKNLATGQGYASTLQAFVRHYTLRPFDPTDGTGPTTVLPVALFIKIFGNAYWVPGLTNVTVWSLLLVSIGILLRKNYRGGGFVFFVFSFLYLSYCLMTFHFEHWYALLGEVPTTLLVVLGVLCFSYRDAKLNQILCGALFALAVESKLLSLLAFVVFLAVHILIYPRTPSERPAQFLTRYGRKIFYVSLGFLIPIGLFELWKLVALGPFKFIDNWNEYLNFVGGTGTKLNQPATLIEIYDERLRTLMERFGVLLPNIGFLLALAWLMVKRDENLKRLFLVAVVIIAVYSLWWIFISNGRARYFILCLILLIFVVTLPFLSSRRKSHMLLYFALVIVFPSNTWIRLPYPFQGVNGQYFKPSTQTQALLETSRILSQAVPTTDRGQIVTEWWATAVDIEYLLDTSGNFTTFRDEALINENSFWVVVNTKFMATDDKDFAALLENCADVQEIGPYRLAKCEQDPTK